MWFFFVTVFFVSWSATDCHERIFYGSGVVFWNLKCGVLEFQVRCFGASGAVFWKVAAGMAPVLTFRAGEGAQRCGVLEGSCTNVGFMAFLAHFDGVSRTEYVVL